MYITPMLSGKISCCVDWNNPKFWSRSTLFQLKHSYRSTSHKKLQKQNNEDSFIQLLYAWLHLTNNNFLSPYLYKKFFCNPYL